MRMIGLGSSRSCAVLISSMYVGSSCTSALRFKLDSLVSTTSILLSNLSVLPAMSINIGLLVTTIFKLVKLTITTDPDIVISVFGNVISAISQPFILALREAASETFDDKWTRIDGRGRYGFVRVWDHPGAGPEHTRPTGIVKIEAICGSPLNLTSVLHDLPKPQDGLRRVYVMELLDDVAELVYCCGDGSISFKTRDHSIASGRSENQHYNRDNNGDRHDNDIGGDGNHGNSDEDYSAHRLANEPAASSCAYLPLEHYTKSHMSLLSMGDDSKVRWFRLESFEILFPAGEWRKDVTFARVERNIQFREHGNHSVGMPPIPS